MGNHADFRVGEHRHFYAPVIITFFAILFPITWESPLIELYQMRKFKHQPPTGPGCPVAVVFLSRATVREAPATILMIVSESPFFAAPVSSCYLYQILVAVLLQFPVM